MQAVGGGAVKPGKQLGAWATGTRREMQIAEAGETDRERGHGRDIFAFCIGGERITVDKLLASWAVGQIGGLVGL